MLKRLLGVLVLSVLATGAHASCFTPSIVGVFEGQFVAPSPFVDPTLRFHLQIDPQARWCGQKRGNYSVSQPRPDRSDAKGTWRRIGGGCFAMRDEHYVRDLAGGMFGGVDSIEAHEFTACRRPGTNGNEFDIADVVFITLDLDRNVLGTLSAGPAELIRLPTP